MCCTQSASIGKSAGTNMHTLSLMQLHSGRITHIINSFFVSLSGRPQQAHTHDVINALSLGQHNRHHQQFARFHHFFKTHQQHCILVQKRPPKLKLDELSSNSSGLCDLPKRVSSFGLTILWTSKLAWKTPCVRPSLVK